MPASNNSNNHADYYVGPPPPLAVVLGPIGLLLEWVRGLFSDL